MRYFLPRYAPDLNVPNMCQQCGCGNEFPIVPPVTAQKNVIVFAGPGITVDDLSDANNYRFEVSREEIEDLTVILTLIAKAAGVTKSIPILKGTTIDRVELDWTYNKVIVNQSLSNTGALTVPTLADSDRSYDYTGQTITSNISFTITGDDGLGLPGSIDNDTQSIAFGNLMWLGAGLSKINQSSSGIEAFIEGLSTNVLKTSRIHTYFATGTTNQKHFVAYPKVYGLGTFTKGIFTGGYVRLKLVGSTLKDELGMLDVESDIMITNAAGYSEAYYLYESLVDDQVDAITPFIIS